MALPQPFLFDEAIADLAQIETYLTIEAGPRTAEKALYRIVGKLHTLAVSPGLGRVRHEFADKPHSFVVEPWVILYEPLSDGGIAVWRVVHGRRDLAPLAKKPD